MRKIEQPQQWVVYERVEGDQSGMRLVCHQSEWELVETRHPGLNKLVRNGIDSETEAEKLARGTSGDAKDRGKKRQSIFNSANGAKPPAPKQIVTPQSERQHFA